MHDDELIQRAIALGATARRVSSPNPWVGCVLVREGEIVGQGATRPPGGAHAEAVAVATAAGRARGATAYVSLEPCSHQGRTGPCAELLVEAGVTRVVASLADPDPQVSGRGFALLSDAGIEVVVGPGAAEAERSLRPYLHHRRTGRAFCVVKAATSLDGRVAARDGSSRWITGFQARTDVHALRAESQAVVIGAGTALADQPSLTVRDAAAPPQPPLRVVLDARGRVPAEGPLFDQALAPTLVVTTERAPGAAVEAWRGAGAKVEIVDEAGGGVDLRAALVLLGSLDVIQALFEGGPTVHRVLLESGLADRVVSYLAPVLLGAGGLPGYGIDGPPTIDAASHLALTDVTRLGDDVRLDYDVPATHVPATHAPEES